MKSATLTQLFAVERPASLRKLSFSPIVVGCANLFFGAAMEHLLKNDSGGYYLSMFLFAELTILMTLTILGFLGNGRSVILKTAIFPMTPWERMRFLLWSNIRRPLPSVMISTCAVILLVLYHSSAMVLFTVVASFGMLFLAWELIAVLICVGLTRGAGETAGIAILSGLAAIGLVLTSLLIPDRAILASLPLSAWAIDAMLLAQQGNFHAVAVKLLSLAATCVLLTLIARKYS